MPRPNRDRQSVTLYIARSGVSAIQELASRSGETRSEIIRRAIRFGLPLVERELKEVAR